MSWLFALMSMNAVKLLLLYNLLNTEVPLRKILGDSSDFFKLSLRDLHRAIQNRKAYVNQNLWFLCVFCILATMGTKQGRRRRSMFHFPGNNQLRNSLLLSI